MLSRHYQGNTWWIMAGIFSLFMISYILKSARDKRKVGIPVDVAAVTGMCVFILIFVAVAIFQVLTHQ
jgi:hypothetical protein